MDKATRVAKLNQLLVELASWLAQERSRLTTERAFLKSVLGKAYDLPVARLTEISKLAALDELRKYTQVTG